MYATHLGEGKLRITNPDLPNPPGGRDPYSSGVLARVWGIYALHFNACATCPFVRGSSQLETSQATERIKKKTRFNKAA